MSSSPTACNNHPHESQIRTKSNRLLRHIQQDAHGAEHHNKGTATVTQERQRNSLCRQKPQHNAHVDESLNAHHHRDAKRKIKTEQVWSAHRCPNTTPEKQRK